MGELMGKGRLNPDGNMGFAAILSFSSSASCSLLALALRFWNQILTWVSVRLRELENSALSAMDRYCFWRNLRSRASSWEVVNGVRGFLFVLCFLRVQAVGLRCPARKENAGYHKGRDTWVLWRDMLHLRDPRGIDIWGVPSGDTLRTGHFYKRHCKSLTRQT